MLNLLRMDLRRMFRSKGFYICFGFLVFTSVVVFALMYAVSNPDIQKALENLGFMITTSVGSPQEIQEMTASSLLDLFHQTNISGGGFPVITGILTTLFVCLDFDSGFIKNILAVHENKWSYIISKMICSFIVNLFCMAGTFVIVLGLNAVTGGFFSYPNAGDALFYLFSIWMLTNAFSTLLLLVCMITRSKAAGITAAFIICSGLIVVILNTLLGFFKANGIMNYTLYMNLTTCPFKYENLVSLRPVIVSVVFIVLYGTAAKVFLAKKDV